MAPQTLLLAAAAEAAGGVCWVCKPPWISPPSCTATPALAGLPICSLCHILSQGHSALQLPPVHPPPRRSPHQGKLPPFVWWAPGLQLAGAWAPEPLQLQLTVPGWWPRSHAGAWAWPFLGPHDEAPWGNGTPDLAQKDIHGGIRTRTQVAGVGGVHRMPCQAASWGGVHPWQQG